MKKVLISILTFFFLFNVYVEPKLILSPIEKKLGTIKEGKKIKKSFTIKNAGDEILRVEIDSPCGCMTLGEKRFNIEPGKKKKIKYIFNSTNYQGTVERTINILSNDPEQKIATYKITVNVKPDKKNELNTARNLFKTNNFFIEGLNNNEIIYYFATESCGDCRKILKNIVTWSKKENRLINIHYYPLEDFENKKNLNKVIEKFGFYPQNPFIIFEEKIYDGKDKIANFLGGEIDNNTKKSSVTTSITIPAITLLGLADGVNPCAFTVIILLISYLSLMLNNQRKDILITGTIYIATVFITYFLVGLGLFEFLKMLSIFTLISKIIKYCLAAFLVIIAFLSLYDFTLALQGKTKEMTLQLPQFLQSKIRKTIRDQRNNYHIFFGAIALGFTISLFELACTGQVYLPAIGIMIHSSPERLKGLFLLTIYNIAFIIPLLFVFILVYKGTSAETIGNYFKTKIALVKMLFFLLCIFFAILTIVI